MLDPKLFEDMNARVSALFAASPAADIEKNVKALLTGFLSRLDLVTREEFEVQGEMLAQARAALKALETRVAQLEAARTAAPGNDA